MCAQVAKLFLYDTVIPVGLTTTLLSTTLSVVDARGTSWTGGSTAPHFPGSHSQFGERGIVPPSGQNLTSIVQLTGGVMGFGRSVVIVVHLPGSHSHVLVRGIMLPSGHMRASMVHATGGVTGLHFPGSHSHLSVRGIIVPSGQRRAIAVQATGGMGGMGGTGFTIGLSGFVAVPSPPQLISLIFARVYAPTYPVGEMFCVD